MFFEPSGDWYLKPEAEPDATAYRQALEAFICLKPDHIPNQVECTHCGISFICDPRNRNRPVIACPFGCREHQQKKSSHARSAIYYATDRGKQVKSELNRLAYEKSLKEKSGALKSEESLLDESTDITSENDPFRNMGRVDLTVLHKAPNSFWCYLSWLILVMSGEQVSFSAVKSSVFKIFRQRYIEVFSREGYMADQYKDQRNKGDPR